MCLACEESDMYYRWQLLQQIAKGEMPEIVEEPDGTKVVRQKAPARKPSDFACDSPNE